MNNPTMLYKHPGVHPIHGDYFDYIIVDESGIEQAEKDGWSRITDEAKAGKKPQDKKPKSKKAATDVDAGQSDESGIEQAE